MAFVRQTESLFFGKSQRLKPQSIDPCNSWNCSEKLRNEVDYMLMSNLSTVVHSLQGCHCPPGLHFHQQNRGAFEVHETNSPHYPGFVIFARLLATKWYLQNCFNFFFLGFYCRSDVENHVVIWAIAPSLPPFLILSPHPHSCYTVSLPCLQHRHSLATGPLHWLLLFIGGFSSRRSIWLAPTALFL